MPEHAHAPLTDDALAKLEFYNERGVITGYDVKRVLTDLREARRILRAVECCSYQQFHEDGHDPTCQVGRYLAAYKGAEHEE